MRPRKPAKIQSAISDDETSDVEIAETSTVSRGGRGARTGRASNGKAPVVAIPEPEEEEDEEEDEGDDDDDEDV
jgi:hypothetical protein